MPSILPCQRINSEAKPRRNEQARRRLLRQSHHNATDAAPPGVAHLLGVGGGGVKANLLRREGCGKGPAISRACDAACPFAWSDQSTMQSTHALARCCPPCRSSSDCQQGALFGGKLQSRGVQRLQHCAASCRAAPMWRSAGNSPNICRPGWASRLPCGWGPRGGSAARHSVAA